MILRFLFVAFILCASACKKKSTEVGPAVPAAPATNSAQAEVLKTNNVAGPASPTNTVASILAVTNTPPVPKDYPGNDVYQKGLDLLDDRENTPNPAAAAKLFREAAEMGNPAGELALGVLYFNGQGVEKDIPKALELYRSAAAKNYPEAQFRLASLAARGIGTSDGKPDFTAAADWARKAAEQGHIEAEYNLATLYAAGQGVPNDVNEAAKWYMKAAAGGHPTAQSNLGVLYANGKALPKDMNEAIKWWRRAAEQNQPTAQYNLGQALHAGKAVPQDKIEAYKWYTLAAATGDRDAAHWKNELSIEMSPTDVAEALKRASAFKPAREVSKVASNQK